MQYWYKARMCWKSDNYSLFINDLVTFLREKCNRGIFVSNDIEELVALMFADDVSSFSDTIVNLQQ